jgi:uncharacterized protein (TIGR01777 family)
MQPQHFAPDELKRFVVTGSSGLIGSSLRAFLENAGHRVDRVVRTAPRPGTNDIPWDPAGESIDRHALEGVDAVVHLAGDNIAAGRWTAKRKESIRRSRVDGTRFLCETLAGLDRRPQVLIAASAIGYYGDRADAVMTEESSPGNGFLAEVCRAWEDATAPARMADIRTVNLRIGVVLSAAGGALAKMLTPFKLGLGGKLGTGRQYMSWIALDDLVGIIAHLIFTDDLSGPVNAVAPSPVTNAEFTKTLGRVLSRPTIFAVPASMVRLAFGEMGRELLLASTRVEPAKVQATDFEFRYPTLEPALRAELGR